VEVGAEDLLDRKPAHLRSSEAGEVLQL